MKAESENGAVDVGNRYLILSVRVRACAEDVDRTVRVTLRGCSQCVPVMGVTERPVNGTSQGSVSAEVGVRASTLWAKHRFEPPSSAAEFVSAVIDSGCFGAWRGHVKTMAFIQTR